MSNMRFVNPHTIFHNDCSVLANEMLKIIHLNKELEL